MNFGNVLTAMVTPFNANEQIDYEKTDRLVEYLLKNGTDGLVIVGTTGESPTMSKEEKIAFIKYVVQLVDKRVPVIAGTGSNNTADSMQMTQDVEKLGVDGIMLVTPYYNKPNQRGLIEHFTRIAKETVLPIMLYNIPGRSAVQMHAETIVELSKIENIVSVKEASGDLDQAAMIIENTPDDFTLYSGDDSLTLPMLAIGASGVVSVSSHIIGNEMQSMIKAYQSGNVKEAAALHRELLPIMNGLFSAPSPAPVKAALRLKGLDTGSVRLPLVPLSDEEESLIRTLLKE